MNHSQAVVRSIAGAHYDREYRQILTIDYQIRFSNVPPICKYSYHTSSENALKIHQFY